MLQEKEDEAMYQKGYRKWVYALLITVEMSRESGIVMKLLSLILMNPHFVFVTNIRRICITIGIFIIRCTCRKFSTACWTGIMLKLRTYISPTRLIHGTIQSGWYKCLQGKHTMVSSFVMSDSQTAHTGLFAVYETHYDFIPISDAVGCR